MKKLSTRILFVIALIGFQYANATTFTVTNTLATGAGSLADAVNAANFDASATVVAPHIIDFSGLASGANTIVITGQLQIFKPILLDGASHVDGVVIIDAGNAVDIALNIFGFGANDPAGCRIRNLAVGNSTSNLVNVDGRNDIEFSDCYFGITPGGVDMGANGNGFSFFNGSTNIRVENCEIANSNGNGISISASSDITIVGSFIHANTANGITMDNATNITIGESGVTFSNYVSGNNASGIQVYNGSSDISIVNNVIGLGLDGTTPLANGFDGIVIVSIAGAATRDVTVGGSGLNEGNVVSGNGYHGVHVRNASEVNVIGNYVGTDVSGEIAVMNNHNGVSLTAPTSDILISKNVVSGNGGDPLLTGTPFNGPIFSGIAGTATDLTIKGNIIGLDKDGTTPLGNVNYGMWLPNCTNVTIGGPDLADRNIVSDNGHGVVNPRLDQGQSPENGGGRGIYLDGGDNLKIINNYVGTDINGSAGIGNYADGMSLSNSSNIIVGGAGDSSNVFSGNLGSGVHLFENTNVRAEGNLFGTNASGTVVLPNSQDGLYLHNQTNTIVTNNTLSGNGQTGLHISGGGTNTVSSNQVGVASDGTTALGNVMGGIRISNSPSNTLTENTVAYSTGASTDAQIGDGYGIYVGGTASTQNYIDQNSVYCNSELNISLSQDGAAFGTVGAGNNDKATPTIYPSTSTSTSTSGISSPGDEIQLFTNEPGCGCGGKTYLGSTTAAGDGTWTFAHGAVADSNLIAVTATSGNNTSQFACKVAISGDPTLTVANTCEDESVDVTLTGHLAAILVWQFASDENFATIIFEDTTDAIADPYVYSYLPAVSGETWVRVISVVGVGNTATSNEVSFQVVANPTFTSVNAIPDSICSGESSSVSIAGATGTVSWFSSTDGTNFTSTTDPSTISPTQTMWYTAQLESATANCTTDVDTVQVTVNALISGSVDLAVDVNGVCEGTEQTFTATITNMGENATIKWFVDGSEQLGESDITFASSGLVDGEVVSLEVTYDTLCPVRATESDQVTVSIDEAVTFNSLTATPETICSGEESIITLDANGVVTEAWFSSTDGTNFNATAAPGTVSPTTSTWYSVTLESANGFCSVQSDTVMITVNPIISGNVTLSVDANDVCDGTTQTFTANTTDVGSGATYVWSVEGSNQSETGNEFVSNSLANGDVVQVVVTSDTICPQSATVSDQIAVIINPILVPTVSISGDLAVCPGEAVNLTALVSNEGSNPSYAWTVDGNPAGTDSPSFSEVLAFGAVVQVQLTSDALCANPTTIQSSQETVVDAGSVVAEIAIEERENNLCSPEALIIDASLSGGGTSPSVRWFVNGTQVSTVTTPFSYSGYNNGDTIHAELTSNATCIADPNALSDSVFVIVKDKLNSSALVDLLSTSGQSGCAGDSLIVFLDTANLGTSPDFNWYINGDIQIENGDSLIRTTVVNDDSVSYSVSVDPSECATDYYFEGFIEVERDTLIDPEVAIAGLFAGCILDTTTLVFIATHDDLDPISYQWYVDGEALLGETNSSISFTGALNADSISVAIQSNKGCLSSDSAYDSKALDFSSPVVAVAGTDQIIAEIQEVTLDGDGSSMGDDVNYLWIKITDEDSTTVGTEISILNEVTTFNNEFVLIVNNKYCFDTASTTVTIESDFHIPNVFSPNADGTHDKWMITGIELYPDVQIEVYNRWGSLVFSTSKGDGYSIDNAWDGTNENGEKLSDATYYYIVTLNNGSEPISKDVTIIR